MRHKWIADVSWAPADRCFDSSNIINCDITLSLGHRPERSSASTSLIKWAIVEIFINGIIDTETIITTSIKILNSALHQECSNSSTIKMNKQPYNHVRKSSNCFGALITLWEFGVGSYTRNIKVHLRVAPCYKWSTVVSSNIKILISGLSHSENVKVRSEERIIINSRWYARIVNKSGDKWIKVWY